MKNKLSIFVTVLIILISVQGIFALDTTDWKEFETEHFTIMYHDLDESTLSMIAEEAENAYDKVTSDLRYQPDNKTIIRIGTNEVDHEWSEADAFYTRDLNIIDLLSPSQKRWMNYESYIRRSIPHEFTHHIINVGYKFTFPGWLNEGTATYEAGGSPDNRTFKRAVAKNELLSLDGMWIFALQEDDERRLAYDESYTVIEYVVKEYGHDGLIDILNAHKERMDTHQVIEDALGISFEEFELGWRSFVKEKYGQPLYELYFYEAFYLIIVALLLKIGMRIWTKRRKN